MTIDSRATSTLENKLEGESLLHRIKQQARKTAEHIRENVTRALSVIDLEKISQAATYLQDKARKPLIMASIVGGGLLLSSNDAEAQFNTTTRDLGVSGISAYTDRPANDLAPNGFGFSINRTQQNDRSPFGRHIGGGFDTFGAENAENHYFQANNVEATVGGYIQPIEILGSQDWMNPGISSRLGAQLGYRNTSGNMLYPELDRETSYTVHDMVWKLYASAQWISPYQEHIIQLKLSYENGAFHPDMLDGRIREGNDAIRRLTLSYGLFKSR